jgi:uncharacterized Tic20 family protein
LSFTLYALIFGIFGFFGAMGILFGSQNSLTSYIFLAIFIILGIVFAATYVISMVIAAIKTYQGKAFRYPMIIRFIK